MHIWAKAVAAAFVGVGAAVADLVGAGGDADLVVAVCVAAQVTVVVNLASSCCK